MEKLQGRKIKSIIYLIRSSQPGIYRKNKGHYYNLQLSFPG